MSSGKPKAKVKDMNLPDAPEPSRCKDKIDGSVRSTSSIMVAKYLERKERERHERQNRRKEIQ